MKFIKWQYSDEMYIQETPVTIREWISVMGDKHLVDIEKTYHPDAPKGYITYSVAMEFINKLGLKNTRLPTDDDIIKLSNSDKSVKWGWFNINADSVPIPVKKFEPTYQGLYDIGCNMSILLEIKLGGISVSMGRTRGNFLERPVKWVRPYTYFSNDKTLPYIGLRLWTKLPAKSY